MVCRGISIATRYEVKYDTVTDLDNRVDEFVNLIHTLDIFECEGGDMGMEIQVEEFKDGIGLLQNFDSADSDMQCEILEACEPFGGVEEAKQIMEDMLKNSYNDDGYIHIMYDN